MQTLSHISLINRLSQKNETNSIVHRDLGASQQLADENAIALVRKWLDDMLPFDESREIISFSTGFFSKAGDEINPEKAIEVGKGIQAKLDGQVPTTTIETKSKVKPLSNLRNHASAQVTSRVNALKYFNRLVIFAQRESDLEKSLAYELTPFPLSLFSEKDQLMHEANKASFAQVCLKDRAEISAVQHRNSSYYVIDGGWLLRQTTWGKTDTWETIVAGYVDLVRSLGKFSEKISVVFDGYESSPKDHAHRRRVKHFCHDMQINLENTPYTTKEKFLSNGTNKMELIKYISNALSDIDTPVIRCRDDADTMIVKSALDFSEQGIVHVRAEDSDILIMLVHHYDSGIHHDIHVVTAKGTYSIKDIASTLTFDEKRFLLLGHAFTGCDTVSSIYGFSKEKLFERLCDSSLFPQMEIFCDGESTKEDLQHAGLEIFQHLYKSPGTPLSTIRVHQFNKQSKAGVIRPESLPPTDSAAIQHSLRAFLQLQDWMVLQSMSRDPLEYGWIHGSFGYEPVFMTEPAAPDSLLKFISCNCKTGCSNQRCSCKKNNVRCVTACGHCHGKECKNVESVDS